MAKVDNDDLIQKYMTPLAKSRKAKCTYTCIYKKENQYFWRVKIIPYIQGQYTILIDIKLWQYDEFITSITHPNEPQHFTDKQRHQGFFAMKPYRICRRDIDVPINPVTNTADMGQLELWCSEVFNDSIARIDSFIRSVESEYGGLNNFLIANATNDPLMAAFACAFAGEYRKAEEILLDAIKKQLRFERCFGSAQRDLSNVLLDYCKAQQTGENWTKDKVIAG